MASLKKFRVKKDMGGYSYPYTHIDLVFDDNNQKLSDILKGINSVTNANTALTLKNARDITIGAKTNKFDGSANITYTLDDIGAAPKSHGTHLTLGTGSGDAFRGDYGNIAYQHSLTTHAPVNAQKNSDITKSEIEAKLTGDIDTHNHNKLYYLKSDIDTQIANLQGDIELTLGVLGNHEDDGHPELYYNKGQVDGFVTGLEELVSLSAGTIVTGQVVDYTKTYNDSSTLVSGATCGTCAEIFNDLTNNRAVGNYSHAEGCDAVASGNCSHAEGWHTRAVSGSSHAEGNQTKASASYTHAEGYQTEASNTAAHAEGYSCIASGSQSHAEGMVTKAIGKYCHSEGYYTEAGENQRTEGAHAEGLKTLALADGAHAEGYCTEAQGKYSHAEGYCSVAVKQAAHAEGYECFAEGTGAHAEGAGTKAYAYQHVQGVYNIPDEDTNYMHIVGNGMDGDNRSNAHTLDWDGNAWYAGNVSTNVPPTAPDHLANKAYVDATCMSYICCTSSQYTSLLENNMINENIIYFITE